MSLDYLPYLRSRDKNIDYFNDANPFNSNFKFDQNETFAVLTDTKEYNYITFVCFLG